jgi:hypothetical protein
MKITKEQLRQLIKEELEQLDEMEPREYFKGLYGGGEEAEAPESDPLRDAVRQFVDAVKDHI